MLCTGLAGWADGDEVKKTVPETCFCPAVCLSVCLSIALPVSPGQPPARWMRALSEVLFRKQSVMLVLLHFEFLIENLHSNEFQMSKLFKKL